MATTSTKVTEWVALKETVLVAAEIVLGSMVKSPAGAKLATSARVAVPPVCTTMFVASRVRSSSCSNTSWERRRRRAPVRVRGDCLRPKSLRQREENTMPLQQQGVPRCAHAARRRGGHCCWSGHAVVRDGGPAAAGG